MKKNRSGEQEQKEGTIDFIKDRIEARDDIRMAKVKKGMPSFGKLIIAIAILGVVAIGLIIAMNIYDPKPNPKPKPIVVITDEKLEQIQELSTAKYTYTETQTYDNWRELPIKHIKVPFTRKTIELKCVGEIKVYYDLKKCKVNETSGRVTVILPKSSISHYIESVEIKQKNNIFNPIDLDDQRLMGDDLKVIMENRAIEKGMLDEAKESAKKTIYSLVKEMLDEGQVLDVHQSSEAIQEDIKYVNDITEKAQKLTDKYKISNIND